MKRLHLHVPDFELWVKTIPRISRCFWVRVRWLFTVYSYVHIIHHIMSYQNKSDQITSDHIISNQIISNLMSSNRSFYLAYTKLPWSAEGTWQWCLPLHLPRTGRLLHKKLTIIGTRDFCKGISHGEWGVSRGFMIIFRSWKFMSRVFFCVFRFMDFMVIMIRWILLNYHDSTES